MRHGSDLFAAVPAVVAIPVRDEAERITDCLLALSRQDGGPPGIVLLVNNTNDGTLQAIEDVRPALTCPVIAIEHRFAPDQADAGHARRMAMQRADGLAPDHAPLLTTDADGRARPDWLAANLYHLRAGIDAVFGRAEIDPVEAARIPPALHAADAQECAYAAVLDQIDSLIDPSADDPWPRHTEHSGASIGVTRQAYRLSGGVPAIRLGEDRAFAAALRRIDARIRHAPEVSVVVSGRILGRAAGGMADTIRRRLVAPETMLDDALEPVADRVRRIRVRQAVRAAFAADDAPAFIAAARLGGVSPQTAGRLLGARHFGEAMEAIDAALPRARVPVASLPQEMARAVAVRDRLMAPALQPAA